MTDIANMNPADAAKELQRVRVSDTYRRLLEKVAQTTMMKAMGKQRDETSFTSLLAWIFRNTDFDKSWSLGSPTGSQMVFPLRLCPENGVEGVRPPTGSQMVFPLRLLATESPVVFLLRLLAIQATAQGNSNGDLMDLNLHKDILLNDVIVSNVSVETEVTTKSKKYGDGRIDLVITCNVTSKSDPNTCKRLRILLENKVDSKEHDSQCKKYYAYFSQDKGAGIDVYVYLAIDKSETLSCDRFIKITYQELLDNVLALILKQDKNALCPSTRRLKDFVDTISSINTDNKTIIAMDEETKKLLKEFYDDNMNLIMAAVESFGSDEEKNAVASVRTRVNSLYDVSYNGKTEKNVAMAKVALVAISMLRDAGKTPEQIDSVLKKSGKFWEKEIVGQAPTSGFTDPVPFPNGDVYFVHTQRYKTTGETFNKVVQYLTAAGFDIKKTK